MTIRLFHCFSEGEQLSQRPGTNSRPVKQWSNCYSIYMYSAISIKPSYSQLTIQVRKYITIIISMDSNKYKLPTHHCRKGMIVYMVGHFSADLSHRVNSLVHTPGHLYRLRSLQSSDSGNKLTQLYFHITTEQVLNNNTTNCIVLSDWSWT